jgi:hypothetical protein
MLIASNNCRGGWVVVQALNDYADDLVAGVIPHPSIHLENMLGRNATDLCKKCQRPVLLLPGSRLNRIVFEAID